MSRKSRIDYGASSALMALSPGRKMSHSYGSSHGMSNDSFYKKRESAVSTSIKQKAKKDVNGHATEGETALTGEGDADEGDSSANQDEEDDDDDEEEAEKMAPSSGSGKHKGRHPAISVSHTSDNDRDTPQKKRRRTGNEKVALSVATPPSSTKKRAFSNISSTSVLFEDNDDQEQGQKLTAYPRKKLTRRLSNNAQGLLKYDRVHSTKLSNGDRLHAGDENAIEESDDDDVYAAVDAISESAQGESDVEMAYEKLIIDSEDENDAGRRLSVQSGMSEFMTFDDADLLLSNVGFFDEQLNYNNTSMVAGIFETVSPSKKVRFEDVEMSDGTSTASSTTENDPFPDLFLQQDHLDPTFRRLIDNVADADDGNWMGSESESSFWDLGGEGADGTADGSQSVKPGPDRSNESEGGSSGYDTETGDTTDDELPPPDTVPKPATLLHDRTPSLARRKTTVPKLATRLIRQPPRRKGPTLGRFDVNRDKASAMLDHYSQRVILYPPKTQMLRYLPESTTSSTVNTANNSPRASFQALTGDESDPSEVSQAFSVPLDLIMGGMVGINGSYLDNTTALLNTPAASKLDVNVIDEESEDFDTDLEALDVNAFLDLGPDSADEDDNADDIETLASPTTPMASQQGDDTTRSMTQSLMEHFDRGVVSAFRSNQDRHRHLSRQAQHPSERASASRAVRTGGSADSLITPVRKQRMKSNATVATGSPLARRRSRATNVTVA